MTLTELAAETLVQKHKRLMREKCPHEADAIWSSIVVSPRGMSTNRFCLDCGKSWHSVQRTATTGDRRNG